jgi:hypothetical protein
MVPNKQNQQKPKIKLKQAQDNFSFFNHCQLIKIFYFV